MIEGPVACRDGSLAVTCFDRGEVYRIRNGEVQVLAITGGGANGAAEGTDGRMFIAQNGGTPPAVNKARSPAGVQVIEPSGALRHFGIGMHSPNDLCFGPDGYLYVTDPTRKPERDDGRIWRCDIRTQECVKIFECDWYPNGIGFSLEDDWMYVADSRHARIVRIPLADVRSGTVETVIEIERGAPDGFAFDADGNLVVACPQPGSGSGDVQVYKGSKLVDVLRPGSSRLYTNLAISQDKRIYLCDADTGSVLMDNWPCAGLPLHPFRK